jgi:hypothetical protein
MGSTQLDLFAQPQAAEPRLTPSPPLTPGLNGHESPPIRNKAGAPHLPPSIGGDDQEACPQAVGRIIHPVGVGDQRVEQRADLQKLMPIPAGARQPRHLHAKHEADLAEADLSDQPLKAQASLDARAGASEIVVDDDDLLAQPAKLRRRSASAYCSLVDFSARFS